MIGSAGKASCAASRILIRSKDPNCLEKSPSERRNNSLTESTLSPFQADTNTLSPRSNCCVAQGIHSSKRLKGSWWPSGQPEKSKPLFIGGEGRPVTWVRQPAHGYVVTGNVAYGGTSSMGIFRMHVNGKLTPHRQWPVPVDARCVPADSCCHWLGIVCSSLRAKLLETASPSQAYAQRNDCWRSYRHYPSPSDNMLSSIPVWSRVCLMRAVDDVLLFQFLLP